MISPKSRNPFNSLVFWKKFNKIIQRIGSHYSRMNDEITGTRKSRRERLRCSASLTHATTPTLTPTNQTFKFLSM